MRLVPGWGSAKAVDGLGYVTGVHEAEVRGDRGRRAERRRPGWRSLGDLAGRSGASAETLGRLAWAGACDALVDGGPRAAAGARCGRSASPCPASRSRPGTQLALPLDPHEGPELRALSAWERMLADYGSTGVTLREHPLELMRPGLPADLSTSRDLETHPHGRRVRVAGLVIARQRPATAKGVTFMLLEDEHGTINLIVPPPVHDRFRLAVRSEPLVLASGRLEAREGTINIVVDRIERLDRPDLPPREGHPHRAPPRVVERRRRAGRRAADRPQLRPPRLGIIRTHGRSHPRRHLELGRSGLRQGVVSAEAARRRSGWAGTRSGSSSSS